MPQGWGQTVTLVRLLFGWPVEMSFEFCSHRGWERKVGCLATGDAVAQPGRPRWDRPVGYSIVSSCHVHYCGRRSVAGQCFLARQGWLFALNSTRLRWPGVTTLEVSEQPSLLGHKEPKSTSSGECTGLGPVQAAEVRQACQVLITGRAREKIEDREGVEIADVSTRFEGEHFVDLPRSREIPE